MFKISGQINYSYTIHNINDVFANNQQLIKLIDAKKDTQCFLLIDQEVYELYGDSMQRYFAMNNIETKLSIINARDFNNNETSYRSAFSEWAFDDLQNDELLLAIGGRVITDLGGFIAGKYHHRQSYIKIPTTLMGYINASMDINLATRKNRIGSFGIPSKVILDKKFLATLDVRDITNGIGEIIKLAITLDPELFEMLEEAGESLIKNKFQTKLAKEILDRTILKMTEKLLDNVSEDNLQRKIDFGHTFSPMIESSSNYEILHGEAIAIDVLFSSLIAYKRGLLQETALIRILNLYQALKLPIWTPYLNSTFMEACAGKQILCRNNEQLPLPAGIGRCVYINDLLPSEIQMILDLFNIDEFSNAA